MICLPATSCFSSRFPRYCGVRMLCLMVLFISACAEEPSVLMESDQAGGLNTSFTPPDMVAQSRAIVQSELRLSIVVNGSESIFAGEAIAESGSVTFPAARGEKLNIVVTWSELYRGQLLVLARAEESTTVPVDAQADFSFTINTENYSTAFDDDQDLSSNLEERNNDTDPRVADQNPDQVVQVPINFRANIPEQLTNVSNDIDQALIAVAKIDESPVQLTREGNTWVSQVTRPENTEVLVNYSFFHSARPKVKLATWEGRRNTGGEGTTVEIASNEYGYEIDDDGDGISNLQETIDGTNPDDRNSPAALPPCEISIFEDGCNNDSDGDGTPDSVETESIDQDGDSIPDYLESKNDDADDDGYNAELDRDEADPCIPDEDAIACDDSDPIEPPEASPLSYDYYEGQFSSMPDFSRLTPASSGTSTTFSLPDSNGVNFYALQFTGKLFIERADVYTFYTESDDGSILYIDGIRVVDNDGTHALAEASGVISLSAGLHDIVVAYFQNDGSEALSASWSSSTIAKETIPETVLFAP